jgi:hypothetical protein
VARSRNHWYHKNSTICSLFTVVGLSNIEVLSVTMEMQLLSSHKIFRTAVNNNKYKILWLCVSVFWPQLSSMRSACVVLHCHQWPRWLYHVLPHYLINGTIFGKRLSNINCVFFSANFVCNISYSKKNSARYEHKYILVST